MALAISQIILYAVALHALRIVVFYTVPATLAPLYKVLKKLYTKLGTIARAEF